MKLLTILTTLTLLCYYPCAATNVTDVTFEYEIEKSPVMESGYYVVIGAYAASKEHYAKIYANKVNGMGYESSYGFSSKRNLFFVYLRYTQNYRESITKMREARKSDEFKEAWVFVAIEDDVISSNQTVSPSPTAEAVNKEVVSGLDEMYANKFKEGNEGEEKVLEDTKSVAEQSELVSESVSEATATTENEPIASNEVSEALDVTTDVHIDDITVKLEEPKKIQSLSDVSLFCNLFNARNHKDVSGEIQVIDAERAKLLKVIKSGDYVNLPDPKNGTGKLLLICDVFGYRKTQQLINYYNPLPDTVEQHVNLIADIYAINFDLIRYHRGDVATMYNVYFFKDAALMRPESKFEVNNLLNMMKENPDYKIKIHGHVNGKHPGKIISQGESDDFFALDEKNNEGFGSAVELSKKRAVLIKDYLAMNGVEQERMEIKAWGGKRMIHDKHSSSAKHNVRVEIEILDE